MRAVTKTFLRPRAPGLSTSRNLRHHLRSYPTLRTPIPTTGPRRSEDYQADCDLDSTTVDARSVKLQVYSAKKQRWVAVSSTPSYADKVVTVTPANTLGSRKKYRVVLNTTIESTTDNNLEQPYKFGFATRRYREAVLRATRGPGSYGVPAIIRLTLAHLG